MLDRDLDVEGDPSSAERLRDLLALLLGEIVAAAAGIVGAGSCSTPRRSCGVNALLGVDTSSIE